MNKQALVVSGGATVATIRQCRIPAWVEPLVIAADSGLSPALTLGLPITAVVGDFDSVDPLVLAAIDRTKVDVEPHPVDKDATDLELAIAAAVARGATEICVLDSMRGRADHFLATMLLLGSRRWSHCSMTACIDRVRVTIVPSGTTRSIDVDVGAILSLIAITDVIGITTSGLHYPLMDETLRHGTTRGVSNLVMTRPITVATRNGTLVVMESGDQQ